MFEKSEILKFDTHAKVNLGLRVLGKREDGYHELVTMMHELDLHDRVEVTPHEEEKLEITGIELAVKKDNLFFQVLEKVRERGHSVPPLKISVVKKIPVGGGLGGGSSNAMGLLSLIGERYGVDHQEMNEIAAELGSDTNFFLVGGTCMCSGRGEQIESLSDQHLYFNLLFPNISCSTPKVFSMFRDTEGHGKDLQERWRAGEDYGHNDLQMACLEAYPEMSQFFLEAKKMGVPIFLSGSGSTCYTYHHSKSERDRAYKELDSWKDDLKVIPSESYFRS